MIKEKFINLSIKKKLTFMIFINTFLMTGIMLIPVIIVYQIFFIRDDIIQEFSTSLYICSGLFFIFCITALLLFLIFYKIISSPIVELSDMMKIVLEKKDYSLRVHQKYKDETGLLFKGFNNLLNQIQNRDQELEEYRKRLEEHIDINSALHESMEKLKISKEAAEAVNIEKSRFILREKKEALAASNKEHKSKDCMLYSILLAEDNLVNQLVAKGILESLKCNVDTACDGIEALELFKQYPYDLVFMDCQMSDMDGYTAASEIRKYEKQHSPDRRIPVVALTAHSLSSDREKCLAAGMDDFVSKPFQPGELKQVIKRWIPEKTECINLDLREQSDGYEDKNKENKSVDINVLNNIRALQKNGKSTLLEKVVQNYLANTPKGLNDLETAVNESSSEQIENIAHSLKSSSGTVGAMLLFEMLKTIEAMGREKRLEETKTLYFKIIEEYGKVKQFLTKEVEYGA